MSPRLTHFAINTDDVDATQAFYGSVFGWQFREYRAAGKGRQGSPLIYDT